MSRSDKLWLGSLAIIIIYFIVYTSAYISSAHIITIKVTEKERWTDGSSGKYLIHSGNRIYENSDSFWFWKFNSVDIQNSLKVGETYKVKVAGWRIEISSSFENIIKICSEEDFLDEYIENDSD